jgi:hypothetical protein
MPCAREFHSGGTRGVQHVLQWHLPAPADAPHRRATQLVPSVRPRPTTERSARRLETRHGAPSRCARASVTRSAASYGAEGIERRVSDTEDRNRATRDEMDCAPFGHTAWMTAMASKAATPPARLPRVVLSPWGDPPASSKARDPRPVSSRTSPQITSWLTVELGRVGAGSRTARPICGVIAGPG